MNSDNNFKIPRRKKFLYDCLAAELSSLAFLFSNLKIWKPVTGLSQSLYALISERNKKNSSQASAAQLYVLNGNLNYSTDIQGELEALGSYMEHQDRAAIVIYNSLYKPLYKLFSWLGLRSKNELITLLNLNQLKDIARLSQMSVCRQRSVIFFPYSFFGFGILLNKLLSLLPLTQYFSLVHILVLRKSTPHITPLSLSIVIPARNEAGNIENAVTRLPTFPTNDIEIIFVEGHSKDNTWDEILRVQELYKNRFKIQALRQSGIGKADACRLGFSQSTGDLITILDADLTMPPEVLPRFYKAYQQGLGGFINGTRLVYPMEGEAMRYLNYYGNLFFAKGLSFLLGLNLADCLCGTKLMMRSDFARMMRWRERFGNHDPFGDFDMLFFAAEAGLGIVDLPICYRARTYGSTNISRFRHGFQLLKMFLIGLFKIRMS